MQDPDLDFLRRNISQAVTTDEEASLRNRITILKRENAALKNQLLAKANEEQRRELQVSRDTSEKERLLRKVIKDDEKEKGRLHDEIIKLRSQLYGKSSELASTAEQLSATDRVQHEMARSLMAMQQCLSEAEQDKRLLNIEKKSASL